MLTYSSGSLTHDILTRALAIVAEESRRQGVDPKDVLGRRRFKILTRPRIMAMRRLVRELDLTHGQVGDLFSGRHFVDVKYYLMTCKIPSLPSHRSLIRYKAAGGRLSAAMMRSALMRDRARLAC